MWGAATGAPSKRAARAAAAAVTAAAQHEAQQNALETGAAAEAVVEPQGPVRGVAGQTWVDPMLADWPDDDFRIFVGDIGSDVTDEMLRHAFSRYPSLQRWRVVRDRSPRFRGYGFVSFARSEDYLRAMREMQGKYIGLRPCKLRRSSWKDRSVSNGGGREQ